MWKSKTSTKTSNLCNQFLIDYLIKKKAHLQQIGMQRKAFVYHAAIMSIKKYPMPIISVQQLKIIYGIGELLCDQLLVVIKHHYRDFLKKNKTKGEKCNEEIVYQEGNHCAENEENNFSKSNSKSAAHTTNFEFNRQRSQQDLQQDSKSCYSVKSATVDRPYKPRPKSQAAYILIQLKNKGNGECSQQILKQILKRQYNQNTGKQFSLALTNLIKQGFIHRDQFDVTLLKLTEKGYNQVQRLQNKTKVKDSQAKIQAVITSFKHQHQKKKINVEEKPQRNLKQLIQTKYENQLFLVIDSRQVKDKQQQCFFQTKLQDKYGIICKSANLPLGDFIWMYDGKVLDYIVERKKADDLISSIHDGRYKEQKYRLKNSGFTNIYYLYEGHLTGANAMSEKEVCSALLKTRVKDGFKVIQVKSISQSIKFLCFMTQSIKKKIYSSTQISTLGTLQDFTANNMKSSKLTIEHIFGLSLKTIPGVGKNSVNQILKYFTSFRSLYNSLKVLNSRLQRVQFLRQLLKGCGVQKTVPQILVDVLFLDQK